MRSNEAIQEAINLFKKAMDGDAIACIKIFEIMNEPGIDDQRQAEIIREIEDEYQKYNDTL